jgi:hypothetical protein
MKLVRPTVSRPVCLGVKPHLGPKTRFLLLSDSCGFVDVGRPLWRDNGSVVYNCSGPRQRSHSQVRVPWDSWTYFTVSDSRLPQPGGDRSPYLYPPGTWWASYTPRQCVPFSSPPTTLKATVEVFEPASTRARTTCPRYTALTRTAQKTSRPLLLCSLVAGDTACPQNCSPVTAGISSPVYTAVTWQWVCMSQYFPWWTTVCKPYI